ncbi:MAG: MoxR family ATPase [Eubacterium sp.]|nr:MoxR family ATPase [Eubacterium sp.]
MKTTVDNAKEQIINAIRTYLAKNKDGSYRMPAIGRLPIYLLGRPGIGKTEIVREVAEEMGLGYEAFSLTHHTRNSLLGLPVIKELPDGRRYTEFTMSEIIAAVEKARAAGHEEGILMLDEFNSVSETVLPTMLAFLQTKNIGEYTLPDGWIITLAGNPSEDNHSARALDMALLDRVRKIEIEFNPEVFLAYAEANNFHPAVLGYLTDHSLNCYIMKPDQKTPEAVTARGWENLSRTLYIMDDLKITATADLVSQFIKSDGVVYDFMGYLTLHAIGCRQSDLNAIILAGKYHEEYAEKWRDLPETTLWLLADHFFCFLTSKKNKSTEFNTYYENIFHFLDLLGNRLVKERVFSQVNKDPYMVKMLVCTHNNTYKRLCGELLNAG